MERTFPAAWDKIIDQMSEQSRRIDTRVYYYDYDGKPNWVRKATSESFVSLNDGHFGKDDNFVFCGAATIPKAKVEHWQKLDGYYSRDDQRLFYYNRHIRAADYDSFEVVPTGIDYLQLAKDKNNFYWNDRIVTVDEFQKVLAEQEEAT